MRCRATDITVFSLNSISFTQAFIQVLLSHLDTPALWGTTARTGCDQLLQCPALGFKAHLTVTWTSTSSPGTRESSMSPSFACKNHKEIVQYYSQTFFTLFNYQYRIKRGRGAL